MKRRYALLGMTLLLVASIAVPAFGGSGEPAAETFASTKKTATKALNKAKKANRTAKDAKKAGNNAQGAADTAQGSASDANTAAGQALARANTAQAAAEGAQTTADSKLSTETFVQGAASASGSPASRTVTAVCPSGSTPTGGGFTLGGPGSDEVTVVASTRFGLGWIVTADEIGAGTAANWTVAASVNCVS